MELSVLILLVLNLLLPAFFLVMLWRPRPADRLEWVMRVLYGAAYLAFIAVAGRWDWLSTALPLVLLLLYLACTALSYVLVRRLPWRGPGSLLRRHGFTAAMTALFLALTMRALSGYGFEETPVEMDFPLADGTYYVGQGGGNAMLNHHSSDRSQRYALDIVALNSFGARAKGLYPRNLADYEIFGRTVVSPCTGVAVSVHDGMPDNDISETDTTAAAGNHIIIACGSVRVLLAHFQKDSIVIDGGSIVTRGEPLGRVGNSGNSSEPHLHIHAYLGGTLDYKTGDGVPMTFDGRFLVRGSTVTVPPEG